MLHHGMYPEAFYSPGEIHQVDDKSKKHTHTKKRLLETVLVGRAGPANVPEEVTSTDAIYHSTTEPHLD